MVASQNYPGAIMTNFAWLIEAPGPNYLGTRKLGKYEFYWTRDHNKALRFYSKQQADDAMMAVRELDENLFGFAETLGEAKPVEHGWVNPGAPPANPSADGEG